MSQQTDYTPDEWKAIAAAPMVAGMLVTMSDLSGPVGFVKEAYAVAQAAAEATGNTSNELIRSVAEWLKAQGVKPALPEVPKDQAGARGAFVETVRQAAAAVAQKSPAEAEEYKRWLLSFAKRAAEASKEGGFLGIGGTLVSEQETAAINELAAALGVSAN